MSQAARRHAEPALSIVDALDDRELFGAAFEPAATWARWRVFLATLFGLPLDPEALATYQRHTGRAAVPVGQSREAWVIAGRRAGKSRIAALVAVYLACFRDYQEALAPGERGTVMLIAADRRQARTLFRYVVGLLKGVPMLARMIDTERAEAIDLSNRVTIEVHTASFRTVRGYTIVAAILDEIGFWPTDDAAEPDTEILAAIRPGMATVPTSLLLAISSPYARRGALWGAYRNHYGKDASPGLVWRAGTREMNPTVSEDVIRQAYEQDATSAAAEYGAEFRRDIASFVSAEVVDAATIPGRHELPPIPGVSYLGFVDPRRQCRLDDVGDRPRRGARRRDDRSA